MNKWMPKENEKFYYCDGFLSLVFSTTYSPYLLEFPLWYAMGNCFKTKEEAHTHMDEIHRRYKEWVVVANKLYQKGESKVKKTYEVNWSLSGVALVQAENEEDAVDKLLDDPDVYIGDVLDVEVDSMEEAYDD